MRPVTVALAAVRVAVDATAAENSDVFPDGSVAVAVMFTPAETVAANVGLKLPLHAPFVVVVVEPRNVFPWLVPAGFEKNSIVNVVLAVELSVPTIVMLEPLL